MTRVNMSRVNMSRVNMSRVHMSRVNMSRVNMSRVNMSRVDMTRVNMTRVNMTREGSLGNHILHVDFQWTPEVAQSHTHFVCFETIDAPSDGDADMLSSGQHYVQLEVEVINPAPAFDQPAPKVTALFYMRVPNAFIISVSPSVYLYLSLVLSR